MFVVLAHLSGALGLFFMGVRMLTEHLKSLNDRRLRLSLARWTRNRWMGFVWGLLAGSVMQSTTVLALVVVSMLKTDLVSSRRAFPILLGGNVGVALLVLIVVLDVKLMALYVLGVAYCLSLAMGRRRASRYRAVPSAAFGLAMIVLGSIMLKESVMPLAGYPWVHQAMLWMDGSLFLPLLGGMALTVVMQSATPPILSAIGMAAVGLVGIDQVLMVYFGACLGSSLTLYALTTTVTGRARQVAMYQVLFNCLLSAVFVPLIAIETYGGVPLVAAALRASGLPLEQALALCMIVPECFTALLRLATLGVETRFIERWWPPTPVEALAKPQFIHDRALPDRQAALRLADLEQRRLLEMFSRHLDAVRRGAGLNDMRDAPRELLGRLGEYLDDLAASCRGPDTDAFRSITTRQHLLMRLESEVFELSDALQAIPAKPLLASWSSALVEGVDILFLVLIDTLKSGQASAWPSTTQLMGDRSAPLGKLRDMSSLGGDSALTPTERKHVLNLANSSRHVFMLITQLAHEYRMASGIDEAFLDNAGLEEPAAAPMAHPQAASIHPLRFSAPIPRSGVYTFLLPWFLLFTTFS